MTTAALGTHPVTGGLTVLAALVGRATAMRTLWSGRPAPLDDIPRRWRGSGPVIVVGGVGTVAAGLQPLVDWIGRLGYDVTTHTAGIGTACGARSTEALAQTIAEADRGGGVHLVAHSRGGLFARAAVAAGAPVRSLVTLGSPFDLRRLGFARLVLGSLVSTAGTLGVPDLARLECLFGECCAEFRRAVRGRVEVPFTSVYSRRDRVVPWRASVDPAARNVEVDGSHLDLMDHPEPLAAVAEALARGNRAAPGRERRRGAARTRVDAARRPVTVTGGRSMRAGQGDGADPRNTAGPRVGHLRRHGDDAAAPGSRHRPHRPELPAPR
ncbi:hypothetical protein [Pseudonocardia sp.]|jgi:hypothetical protein|uniref:hypothetical protein n=1 Tax=Pseudonocardia sp. TaxID=60912 RepID=UPI003D0D3A5C